MSRHLEGQWWHIPIIQSVLKCYQEPTYIEIGVDHAKCFNEMLDHATCYGCDTKESTWEAMKGGWFYCGTSDEFFDDYDYTSPDVIFIDGDHAYEQVQKDFDHALDLIGDNGTIILHDTFPLEDPACGTAYKILPYIKQLHPVVSSYTFSTWPGLTLVNV